MVPKHRDDGVAQALERVIAWLRQTRRPFGLSASAFSVLSLLEVSGPQRITDLAAREGMTQPGMTTLINRLEESGAVTRTADPADRRAVLAAVTPAGVEQVTAYRGWRADAINERLDRLSEADRRALAAAVPALIRFADATEPPTTTGTIGTIRPATHLKDLA